MKSPAKADARSGVEGVFVAAVTPRRAQENSIDLGATLEMIDFLCSSKVQGITLLGSTGEFVHFALDDRRHMVNFAVRRSRLPVLVNVSHSTLDAGVELAREAANSGVAGVLVMPPYYFKYNQEAIRSFYLAFAADLGSAVPIYLYNIPQFTSEIGIATATELLSTGLFAGIKDSSGSLDYMRALGEQATKTPFTLFAGNEVIYSQARAMGARGIISGVASAVPELIVALENAIAGGAADRVAQLEARVAEFVAWLSLFPLPVAIKEAAKLRKIKTGAYALPLGEAGERKLAEFREWFKGWLPQVQKEAQ